ncbi:helix-turn-helix domain-containing protein [Streptacidiphilus griseoplanus]|uniref:helix-turn-helix domain-containing protein n=1 Tax=Peterkaempfera griseoplana TaxID=66896 RepID=UPI001C37803C|nr:helix-turn-helix domain-containing protein [Peterkaempfera griseoplana]
MELRFRERRGEIVVLPIDDPDAALYAVGQVAAMLDVQVAFLRRLDEQGVVVPVRSAGGQRRYSRREIDRVAALVKLIGEGLTLEGARRVLDLQARVEELEADLHRAHGD